MLYWKAQNILSKMEKPLLLTTFREWKTWRIKKRASMEPFILSR